MAVRPETLTFVDRAPVVATAERTLPASPERVFDVLADARSWPHWFPGVTRAAYRTPEPHGVDAVREITLGLTSALGGVTVGERFLVWDRPTRWGFTFVDVSLPGVARAGVELCELTPAGPGRTRLRYTMAVEPPLPLGPAAAGLSAVLRLGIGRGLAGLEKYLRTS